ncbi:MAG: uncharacterized protein JWL85_1011 [Candidatus Saccharibacteria bacterium]|nr:uncharacterized protein [Candidatus Saccharibacteria bacterium]
MANYKVIQDIEAEDKLLGWLTLRQFIYAIVVALSGFVAFRLALAINWWVIIPFLPHMILFSVLASPLGHEQSSEIWLLAKIRFFLKPRKRIWDQSGIVDLVTITVPKKIEKQLTKNLSQTEVKSRLKALANTIDSRGWAVKNVNINLFSQPSYAMGSNGSDRLLDPSTLPQEVPNYDAQSFEDVLDEQNSPTAQHFTQLIADSTQTQRASIVAKMQQASVQASSPPSKQPQADYWFMNQQQAQPPTTPGYATFDNSSLVQPGLPQTNPIVAADPTADEQALAKELREHAKSVTPNFGHMRVLQPLSEQTADTAQTTSPPNNNTSVTAQPDPAILELANNDDLNVATLARQANKKREQPPEDEVIISLR